MLHTCRNPSTETDWTVLPRPISSARITFVSFLQLCYKETNARHHNNKEEDFKTSWEQVDLNFTILECHLIPSAGDTVDSASPIQLGYYTTWASHMGLTRVSQLGRMRNIVNEDIPGSFWEFFGIFFPLGKFSDYEKGWECFYDRNLIFLLQYSRIRRCKFLFI